MLCQLLANANFVIFWMILPVIVLLPKIVAIFTGKHLGKVDLATWIDWQGPQSDDEDVNRK